jgi:hypothetical protein
MTETEIKEASWIELYKKAVPEVQSEFKIFASGKRTIQTVRAKLSRENYLWDIEFKELALRYQRQGGSPDEIPVP